jgi:hypothetical protein
MARIVFGIVLVICSVVCDTLNDHFRLADANDVLHDGARYANLLGVEVYVFPLQCEELAPSQARSYGQQHESPFSEGQIREQSLDLIRGQNIWCCTSLCTLSNPLDGITVAEVVPTTMIEQQTHHVPYFAARSRSPV